MRSQILVLGVLLAFVASCSAQDDITKFVKEFSGHLKDKLGKGLDKNFDITALGKTDMSHFKNISPEFQEGLTKVLNKFKSMKDKDPQKLMADLASKAQGLFKNLKNKGDLMGMLSGKQ